jgi:hypothetical protein
MSDWTCGIAGCAERFGTAEAFLTHQVDDHATCTCAVCGETHPEGFLAIRHAFTEHTRAEYVRAYDADSDDIRLRERLIDTLEEQVDLPSVLGGLDVDTEDRAVSAGD